MKARIREVVRKRKDEKTPSHPTVFHDILDSDLPAKEKKDEGLWQEAQIICIAGTETTAWTLSVITFYLLSNPNILQKLREELQTAMPDTSTPVTSKHWEQLPYLVCVCVCVYSIL